MHGFSSSLHPRTSHWNTAGQDLPMARYVFKRPFIVTNACPRAAVCCDDLPFLTVILVRICAFARDSDDRCIFGTSHGSITPYETCYWLGSTLVTHHLYSACTPNSCSTVGISRTVLYACVRTVILMLH
eukprot:1353243-Amorphochlora_amoeboformis.AAC.1